jgi:cobalt-zinc-cadmium efflux system membrane fusion protein
MSAVAMPIVIAGLLTLSGCSNGKGAAREAPEAPDSLAGDTTGETSAAQVTFTAAQASHGGVRWAPVVASEVMSMVELPGQLVPDEDRTARLGAPAQGRVLTVHVRPGEHVGRGQRLVTLQSAAASAARADYDKAVAELASRRAAATYARTARERADRLLAIKAASRQEAERAAADEELARAGLAQAEAEVARAQAAMAQLGASSASGAMVLRSPVAGVVLSRDAVPGMVAEPGAPLATVSDPRSLWLEIAAPDRVAGELRAGTHVRFTVPAFPADTFEARVQSVGGALDAATRTVPIRAVVPNRSGRLRPAMFATTWIEGGAARPAVLVPDSAVQLLDNRHVVFVATPDGSGGARFERRDVEVGTTAGGQTQVLSGLRPGETVVVAGAFAVKSEFARSRMAEG